MTAALLTVEGLSAKLKPPGANVIEGISFLANRHEVVSVLGPSGCGKTTLLRAIAGLIEGVCGRTTVDGNSVDGVPPELRRTCIVSHRGGLFPHMNVIENVAFPYRAAGLGKGRARSEALGLLTRFDLDHLEHQRAGSLSQGEHQQVVLARALASRPKVLLLDEPLTDLHPTLHRSLRELIRGVAMEFDAAVVQVTHDQKEAMIASDAILLMNEGRVVQFGTPREIWTSPVNAFAADFIALTNVLVGDVDSQETLHIAQLQIVGMKLPPGKASVAVRPHHWQIRPSNALGLQAIVKTRRYVGSFTEYEMSSGAGPVIVHDHIRCALEVGAPVSLGLLPENVAVLR